MSKNVANPAEKKKGLQGSLEYRQIPKVNLHNDEMNEIDDIGNIHFSIVNK